MDRYHEGRITAMEASYPPSETWYIGEHTQSEEDGNVYAGYAPTFRCTLRDLRVRPNVYDLLLNLGSLSLGDDAAPAAADAPMARAPATLPASSTHQAVESVLAESVTRNAVSLAIETVDSDDLIQRGLVNSASSGAAGGADARSTPTAELDVYLSFASCDWPATRPLLAQLRASGLRVIAHEARDNADAAAVVASMRRAPIVLVIVSDGYAACEASAAVLTFGKKVLGLPILPVCLGVSTWSRDTQSAVSLLLAGEELFDLSEWGAANATQAAASIHEDAAASAGHGALTTTSDVAPPARLMELLVRVRALAAAHGSWQQPAATAHGTVKRVAGVLSCRASTLER